MKILRQPSRVFDDSVDSVVRQERRLTDRMRGFKPVIETYIQEEGPGRGSSQGSFPTVMTIS